MQSLLNTGVPKSFIVALGARLAVVLLICMSGTASAATIGNARSEKIEDTIMGTETLSVGSELAPTPKVAEINGMSLLLKRFRSEYPEVYDFVQDLSDAWTEMGSDSASTPSNRKGRTLEHYAQKFNFVEAGLQNTLLKIVSLFFKPTSVYRKDGSVPAMKTPEILKPLLNIPKFLTSNPINFKRHLSNIQHVINKRSVGDTQNGRVEQVASDIDSQRQGRTLHRIIPNFESNFNRMFRNIFPTLNQQVQSQASNDNTYGQDETSTNPNSHYSHRQGLGLGSSGSVGFTNLMRMIPQIFNRGGEANYGQNQQQNFISEGLQRLMAMLRRPIFNSNRNQYS